MATKKITELPLIQTISGSFSVVPIVIGNTAGNGTTDQITIENFSKFVTAYSAHTGSTGNTFVGPQIINNNVTINGRLTVTEVVAQYETASILFSTGSTKLGDQLTDKHEFTGSTNITGSVIYNGVILTNIDANTIQKLQQATASIELASASFNYFYQSTASLQQFTSSQDARNFIISQFTSSTDAHIVGISTFTSSQYDTIARVYQTSASINIFTGSQDDRNYIISQYTSSTDAHIVGISAFTSSQLAVNLGNSIYTASVDSHIVGISTYTSSVRDTLARVHQSTASLQQFTASQDDRNLTLSTVTGSLIGITNGLMAFTAALDNTYATDAQLYQLYQATRSLELHSGSMVGVTNGLMAYTASNSTLNTGLRGEVDGIEAYTASLKAQAIVSSSTQVQNYDVFALNSNLYTSTGSLIGITNGLMAFTAALDNTYATDAQLFQLYQATRSIELTTGSLIGITNGLMAFTAALDNTYATDAQLYQLYQSTQSLELHSGSMVGVTNGLMSFSSSQLAVNLTLSTVTGSLIGITNGLMAFTAALDNTYATDAQLYQLYAETASIKAEIAGIEAYTASLKAASIVSSSTQVQNYDVFALNSNLYNSTGSIKGEIAGIEAYTASLKGAAIVSSSQQITNYNLFAQTASANIFYNYQAISGSKLELHTSDANGGLVINSKATATQTFITLLDRGTNDNSVVATFEDTNGSNQLGGLKIEAGRKDNQAGIILKGKNKVANSNAVNGYITSVIGNAYSDNALTTLTTGVTGKSISFLGQDTELANLNFNGDLTITNGNLVVANGKGIDFSATSNGSGTTSSELLNDYEEGTWTPTLISTGASFTYGNQGGWYTKVGNLVYAQFYIRSTATSGTITNALQVGNLPFTSNSSDPLRQGMVSFSYLDGFTGLSYSNIFGYVIGNQTNITLLNGSYSALSNILTNNIQSAGNTYIVGVAIYQTN